MRRDPDNPSSQSETLDVQQVSSTSRSLFSLDGFLGTLKQHGQLSFWVGASILATIVLAALFAPFLTSADPFAQSLGDRHIMPIWDGGTWQHPFGTDKFGRDVFARLLVALRVSLVIGIACVAVSFIIGVSLGLLGGYYGGRVDAFVLFLISCRLALPVVLIALALAALSGSSITLLIFVLGFLLWDRFAVVTRTATQQIKSLDYVTSASLSGCSTLRIVTSEILPNISSKIVVIATLEVSHAILLEAALSFLGFGVQPPTPSLGSMISESKQQMTNLPWLMIIPGLALFAMVLSINLIGDGFKTRSASDGDA